MLLTTRNRQKILYEAVKQDAVKLGYEVKMMRDLKPLFKRIAQDFKQAYGEARMIPGQTQYLPNLLKIITKYQEKTGDIFKVNLRVGIGEQKKSSGGNVEVSKEKKKEIDDKINSAVAAFIAANALLQSEEILKTNEKKMREYADRVTREAEAGKEIISYASLAASAASLFFQSAQTRLPMIAEMNIGTVAEFSKQAEAKTLNDTSGGEESDSGITMDGEEVPGAILKGWLSMQDDRVRPAHVEADQRYLAEPIPTEAHYVVMDELMEYPKDPAGSEENIANCRCQNTFFFDKDESTDPH